MTDTKIKPSVVKLIESLAYKLGAVASLSAVAFVVIFGSLIYVWFHYERLNTLLKSLEKTISQSILLGDRIHIASQFESLVDSEIVSGVWLFDTQSEKLIGSSSAIQGMEVLFESSLPVFSFVSKFPAVFVEKEIRSRDGDIVGRLKSCVLVSIRGYLSFLSVFLFALFSAIFFLVKRFRDIGFTIGRPIVLFSQYLSKQTSLSDNLIKPHDIDYREIDEVYTGYLQLIEQLKIAENYEKEAMVGRITSQLSHDLRAPLNSIERLLYLPPNITVESQRSQIVEALNRLNAMIESLRHADLELLTVLQQKYFELTSRLGDIEAKALSKKVKISLANPIGFWIYVDFIKFERAWINLASNAIDFAKTEVRIEVETANRELILRVIDDGPGVSDEILPKLFQRGATYGKHDGTGLGLAYVRQIMRGHGGDVTYRRENNLTVFECRLPNAVVLEEEQALNNTASLGLQLTQKMIRTVAICLHPPELSKSVLARLSSLDSGDFFFTEERDDANVVVSNVEDIMIEVLEADEKEFVAVGQLKGDEDRIVDILKRKFNIV